MRISPGHNLSSTGPRVGSECVAFLLNSEERQLFLSEFSEFDLGDVRQVWIDTAELTKEEWTAQLEHVRPTVLITAWSSPPVPLEWGLQDGCPLRYVCNITGSVRHIVTRELIKNGLLVTNWGTLTSWAVAEHALLLVLALLRSLPLWGSLIAEPKSMFAMQPKLRSRTLRGKRVGLHGFGSVARDLVSLLGPYDVQLAAYSAGVPRALMDEFGVTYCSDLAELFSQSEVLIECEGLTPSSRGSVTEAILRLLPEDSVFVNVGRGAVVEESALARLAVEGRLRVGLDVFEREPLPADSPLRGCGRVILSPHVAGPTWENYPQCGRGALENVDRYLRGEVLERLVTLEAFDRAT
jgi:phosphoglycerate dehydrogenase-like enzyme